MNIGFELLDAQTGVIAYLWNYTSGFAETSMTNAGGRKFTVKLTGKTQGSVIQVACKFAYAGGMSVTKTFTYTIGNSCLGTGVENQQEIEDFFFPNPVQNLLHLQLNGDKNRVVILDLMGRKVFDKLLPSVTSIDMGNYEKGIYFIRVENSQSILNGKVIKK